MVFRNQDQYVRYAQCYWASRASQWADLGIYIYTHICLYTERERERERALHEFTTSIQHFRIYSHLPHFYIYIFSSSEKFGSYNSHYIHLVFVCLYKSTFLTTWVIFFASTSPCLEVSSGQARSLPKLQFLWLCYSNMTKVFFSHYTLSY